MNSLNDLVKVNPTRWRERVPLTAYGDKVESARPVGIGYVHGLRRASTYPKVYRAHVDCKFFNSLEKEDGMLVIDTNESLTNKFVVILYVTTKSAGTYHIYFI